MNKKKKSKTSANVDTDSKDSDFSFENEAERAVDKMFSESGSSDEDKPKLHHITERIQGSMEIKHNPPDKGFLNVKVNKVKVKYTDRYGEKHETDKILVRSKDIKEIEHFEISDGLFAMDFRNDCNFWHNRSPEVVPAMIKQAVHTHVDIKKCYDMTKRKTEIPLWLILAMIGGAGIIIAMVISLLT